MTGVEPYQCTCPRAWWGIYPPPPCAYCMNGGNAWGATTTTMTFQPQPQPMSDADVERIAKRVAELLKPEPTERTIVVQGDSFSTMSPRLQRLREEQLVADLLGTKPKDVE